MDEQLAIDWYTFLPQAIELAHQVKMVYLKLTTLALAALHTLGAVAQIPEGLSVRRELKNLTVAQADTV